MSSIRNLKKSKRILLYALISVMIIAVAAVLIPVRPAFAATTTRVADAHIMSGGYIWVKFNDGTSTSTYRITCQWNSKPDSVSQANSASRRINFSNMTRTSGSAAITAELGASYGNTYNGSSMSGLSSTSYLYVTIPIKITVPAGYVYSSISYDRPTQPGTGATEHYNIYTTNGNATTAPTQSFANRGGTTFTAYLHLNIANCTLKTTKFSSGSTNYELSNCSLTTVWRKSKLTLNYYPNGATLDAKTGAPPASPLGTYSYNYGATNFAEYGLSDPDGGTWNLQKPGYTVTNNWHIGSATGTIISAATPYATTQAMASALGQNINAADKSVNLYADFTPNTYTVSLDDQGADTAGTGAVYEKYNTGVYLDQDCSQDLGSNAITPPQKAGYDFAGYYSETEGEGVQLITAAGLKNASNFTNTYFLENSTIYAKWTPKRYGLSFSPNGGRLDSSSVWGANAGTTNNGSLQTEYQSALNNTVGKATRQGYTFRGWKIASDTVYDANGECTAEGGYWSEAGEDGVWSKADADEVTTLEASWEEHTATVTYYANGHGTAPDPATLKYTEAAAAADALTEAGYTFKGWNTRADGNGTTYSAGAQVKAANVDPADMSLYAMWEANTYTVYFNTARGSFASSKEVTYDSKSNNSPGAPSTDGYEFTGWYTSESGGTKVFDEDGVCTAEGGYWSEAGTNGVWKGTQDLTVHAQWKKEYDFTTDNTVSGIEFDRFPVNADGTAQYDFTLEDGRWAMFPGLDRGSKHEITEDGKAKYKPSYTVSDDGADYVSKTSGAAKEGQSLTAQEESLQEDTSYDYLNRKVEPEGIDIGITKKLAGDRITAADRSKLFVFRYYLKDLEPGEVYTLDLSHTTDASGDTQENITITAPPGGGTVTGEFAMHADEKATIRNLPEGAKYALGETGRNISVSGGNAEYAAWYEVQEGSETTDVDYRFYTTAQMATIVNGLGSGLVAGTGTTGSVGTYGFETLEKDSSVEYEFVNAKYGLHDLTIEKRRTSEGEDLGDTDEEFHFALQITGLMPNTTYQTVRYGADETVGGSFTSDATGKKELEIDLKAAERFTIRQMPGSAVTEILEDAYRYIPTIRITEDSVLKTVETGEYGEELKYVIDGLSADTKATITNDEPKYNPLKITKAFSGFKTPLATADFTVKLTGLESSKEYTAERLSGSSVISTEQITSDASGTLIYTFSLKDEQSVQILRLPRSARYQIEEAAKEGVSPSYYLVSTRAQVSKSNDFAEKGESLSTPRETMTIPRSYIFYNDITTEPEKTVSDGDGITKTGKGEEVETDENTVPKLTSNWIYHIDQEIPVPVSLFKFYDTLPPYIRTVVYDDTETAENAPMRIYWTDAGGVRHGGAVTEYDEDKNLYYVKEGSRRLFSIEYDESSTDTQSQLNVQMLDEDLLLQGDGHFDIYFRAFVDPKAKKADLIEADCYDGMWFYFDNDATTLAGTTMLETGPVRTWIPESGGLTVTKAVDAPDIFKDPEKAFVFTVRFDGLDPGEEYSYLIPKTIDIDLLMENDQLTFTAADETGKVYRDVLAHIYDDEGNHIANMRRGVSAQLPAGVYTVEFEWKDRTVTKEFEIVEKTGGGLTLDCSVSAQLYGGGDEEEFVADANGSATAAFALMDGQHAVFNGLPEGTIYEIEESAEEGYWAEYSALAGSDTMETPQASNNKRANRRLNTGKNTYTEDVTIQYTNHPVQPHVKLLKTNTMGTPLRGAELALYQGVHEITIPENAAEIYTAPDSKYFVKEWISGVDPELIDPIVPGEYTLIETKAPDGYKVASPVVFRVKENGTHQIRNERGEYDSPVDEDVNITIRDEPLSATDLILKKIVSGDLGDLTKQFEFTVELSGLKANEKYERPYDPTITDTPKTYTADSNGNATVTVKLRSGETSCIPNIPFGATYQVKEAASDHVASYTIASETPGAVIEKEEDTNGRLSAKSLSTETETVDEHDNTVYVTYRNNRDYGALTGIPSYYMIWLTALLLCAFALAGLHWRKRRMKALFDEDE